MLSHECSSHGNSNMRHKSDNNRDFSIGNTKVSVFLNASKLLNISGVTCCYM